VGCCETGAGQSQPLRGARADRQRRQVDPVEQRARRFGAANAACLSCFCPRTVRPGGKLRAGCNERAAPAGLRAGPPLGSWTETSRRATTSRSLVPGSARLVGLAAVARQKPQVHTNRGPRRGAAWPAREVGRARELRWADQRDSAPRPAPGEPEDIGRASRPPGPVRRRPGTLTLTLGPGRRGEDERGGAGRGHFETGIFRDPFPVSPPLPLRPATARSPRRCRDWSGGRRLRMLSLAEGRSQWALVAPSETGRSPVRRTVDRFRSWSRPSVTFGSAFLGRPHSSNDFVVVPRPAGPARPDAARQGGLAGAGRPAALSPSTGPPGPAAGGGLFVEGRSGSGRRRPIPHHASLGASFGEPCLQFAARGFDPGVPPFVFGPPSTSTYVDERRTVGGAGRASSPFAGWARGRRRAGPSASS